MPKKLTKNFFILSALFLLESALSQTNSSLQEKAKRDAVFAEFDSALSKTKASLAACQFMRHSTNNVMMP